MGEALCPQCGSPNSVDANFCAVCGTSLPDRGQGVDDVIGSVRAGLDLTDVNTAVNTAIDLDQMGMVVVTSGSTAGARYAITEPLTTIGRHPDSSIFLDDVTVSR